MTKKLLRKKLALMLATLKKKRPFYTELEYLESTGTQWIDTGIAPSNITPIVKMKFIPTQQYSSGSYGIFGCFGANNTRFQIFYNSIGIGTYVLKSWQANATYEVELNGKVPSATINGSVETSGYSNANGFSSYNMYLFTRNNSDVADSGVPLKLYYCKIYDNDILVRDFIPVLDWNYVPCMYDRVTEQLFYNAGTGDFTYGREIHPVEYLESTGTQYIDMLTNPKQTTKVISNFELTSVPPDTFATLFGAYSGTSSNGYALFLNNTVPIQARTGLGSGGNIVSTYNVAVGKYEAALEFNKLTINGTAFTKSNTWSNVSENMYLFSANTSSYTGHTRITPCRIYYTKVYDGETLVRDFIPMIDAQGVGAMFDRVTHTIYDNAGTGAFGYSAREVEYLTSDGNQYIDTGIQPTDDYGYKIRNTYTRGGGEQCAIGCMDTGNRFVGVYTSGTENQLSGAWGSFVGFLPTFSWDTGDILDVEVNYKNSRKMIVNGTELKDISDVHISGAISNTLYLFARHYGNTITKMKGNVYGVEITNGQNVVADFIPAFKDGQIGMYDKVSGVLKTSIGTGSFTKGKIIEPEYE